MILPGCVPGEVSTRFPGVARLLSLAGDQRVLPAFLCRKTLFDQVAEDRLGVVRVDPDPARHFAGLGARVRLRPQRRICRTRGRGGAYGCDTLRSAEYE